MEGGRGAQFRTNHTRTAMMNFLNHVLAAVLGGFAMVCVHGDICTSSTNVFTVVVDLHASELGYVTFKECQGVTNPTIGIELGESYIFAQEDISNWYHPLGFAYFPDGNHDNKPELDPTITQTGSSCVHNNSCPTPQYLQNGVVLGKPGTKDYGVDVYEPAFAVPLPEWAAAGNYSIELTFDDASYTSDIFYFCHIHQYMSGRIKILKGGVPVSSNDSPALGYSYDVPGTFDIACGTFGLDAFQLPNSQCPDHFVCNADQGSSSLASYSACIDAMNCAMMDGMTTGVTARSEDALFVHQMIPHHQNAVNMAKATLIVSTLSCRNITNQDDPDCVLEMILRDIINSQNHQIQLMRNYLTAKGLPQTDNCLVRVETVSIGGSTYNSTSGSASANSSLTGAKNSPRKSGVVAQASHAIIVLLFAMAAVLLL